MIFLPCSAHTARGEEAGGWGGGRRGFRPRSISFSLVVAIFLLGEDVSCGGPDDLSHPDGHAVGGTHRGFDVQGYHNLGWWFGILFVGKESLPRNPAPVFADTILRLVLVKSWKL